MGVQPRPVYDVPDRDLIEVRRDMWLWAEPVIHDYAADSYAGALPDSAASMMARKHCRLWQAVIYDQPDAVPQLRHDLHRAGEKFGISTGLPLHVDERLLGELVDIVLSRFRSSRRTTDALNAVLKSAPACLDMPLAA